MRQKEFRPSSGTGLPKLRVDGRGKGQLIQGQMATQKQKPLSENLAKESLATDCLTEAIKALH